MADVLRHGRLGSWDLLKQLPHTTAVHILRAQGKQLGPQGRDRDRAAQVLLPAVHIDRHHSIGRAGAGFLNEPAQQQGLLHHIHGEQQHAPLHGLQGFHPGVDGGGRPSEGRVLPHEFGVTFGIA